MKWLLIASTLFFHSSALSETAKLNQLPILYVGDSHSIGPFGQTLIPLIATTGKVTAIASCGSSPSWWLHGNATACGYWQHNANGSEQHRQHSVTPRITDLIRERQPTLVIVALGSNLIQMQPTIQRQQTEEMLTIISNGNIQCLWIGPPVARKFSSKRINELYVLLGELTKKYNCILFDSRKYSHYPNSGGDGLHYEGTQGRAIAKKWAIMVFQNEIQRLLNAQKGK